MWRLYICRGRYTEKPAAELEAPNLQVYQEIASLCLYPSYSVPLSEPCPLVSSPFLEFIMWLLGVAVTPLNFMFVLVCS